jgi:hypothetical protein
VTAPLALGCESGGRQAGNKAPDPENPGRTEQTLQAIPPRKGNTQAEPKRGRRRVRAGEANVSRLDPK